jgi:hypothetical protein
MPGSAARSNNLGESGQDLVVWGTPLFLAAMMFQQEHAVGQQLLSQHSMQGVQRPPAFLHVSLDRSGRH